MSMSDDSLFEGAQEVSDNTIHEQEFSPLQEDTEIHGSQQKRFREEFPTGLSWLFEVAGKRHLVDFALENAQSNETYSKTDLSDKVGPSRKTIHEHLPDLVEVGIYEELGEGNKRYRVNDESAVLIAASILNDSIIRSLE